MCNYQLKDNACLGHNSNTKKSEFENGNAILKDEFNNSYMLWKNFIFPKGVIFHSILTS